MRIAVMVIGVPLALLIFLQGCTAGVAEDVGNAEEKVGGWGIIVGFAYLLGSALVVAFPLAAAVIFGLTGLVAIAVAVGTAYGDMWIWGAIAFVLAGMAFLGRRGKRQAEQRAADQAALVREARDLLAQRTVPVAGIAASAGPPPVAAPNVICPRCGAEVAATVRFCPNCGLQRTQGPA
jgi:amino acid transporter